MSDRHYWFRKRRFGLGWSPRSWEGWAATAVFVLLQSAGAAVVRRAVKEKRSHAPQAWRLACAAAFTAVVIATGEPLR